MNENQPISSGGSIRIGQSAASKPPSSTNGANGAAFQALIEELETKARMLAAESQQVSGPTDLAQAVDNAHKSLQDALSLSDRLLEAYRASMHAPDAATNAAKELA